MRKKKEEFLFALERRKRNRDHWSWADFAEGESISLEAEEHLSKAGSSRYVSSYSQNSCLYLISPFGHFKMLNFLLIGVDEKGYKLLCWNWFFVYLLCSSFSWCHWSHLILFILKICFKSFPYFSPWIYPWNEAIYVHFLLTLPWEFFFNVFIYAFYFFFQRC